MTREEMVARWNELAEKDRTHGLTEQERREFADLDRRTSDPDDWED
jgi:uncharacterized protein YnzC (UPF0291/DUF896 family)